MVSPFHLLLVDVDAQNRGSRSVFLTGMARKEEHLTAGQKVLAIRFVSCSKQLLVFRLDDMIWNSMDVSVSTQADAEPPRVFQLQLQLHGDPGRTYLLLQRLHRLHPGRPLSPQRPRAPQEVRGQESGRALAKCRSHDSPSGPGAAWLVIERTEPAPGGFGSRLPRASQLVSIKPTNRRHHCPVASCSAFRLPQTLEQEVTPSLTTLQEKTGKPVRVARCCAP